MNTNVNIAAHDDLMVDEPQGHSVDRVMSSIRNFATVSEALRLLGAAVILASMSVFLLQGWNSGNDISRYLLLLSQTGLLAAAGFAMSFGLKETKGARLFFGLALVSIPANFTILSALLYSVFQWDGALGSYPEYATWQIGDIAVTGMTVAGAMLVLVPVTLFCFAIMARKSAVQLSLHFLVLNSLLLLPIRSSAAVGVIAFAATVYALYVAGKLAMKNRALTAPEGKFAIATLFIPIGVILFRSMYFYQADSLLVTMLLAIAFVTLRQISMLPGRNPRIAIWMEALSLPVALLVAISLTDSMGPLISLDLRIPMFAAAFALLSMDIARRTACWSLARFTAGSASIAACLSLVFNVTMISSPIAAIFCLIAGAIMVIFGHGFKVRVSFLAGCVCISAGIIFGFTDLVDMVFRSNWIQLAVFGASAIALGSVLDRHGAAMKLRISNWFSQISSDERLNGRFAKPNDS
jgi:hypothetical protein